MFHCHPTSIPKHIQTRGICKTGHDNNPPLNTASFKLPFQSPAPTPASSSVPNPDGDNMVMRILTLVEMLKETQNHSKMNFMKDLDFVDLPQQIGQVFIMWIQLGYSGGGG